MTSGSLRVDGKAQINQVNFKNKGAYKFLSYTTIIFSFIGIRKKSACM